MVPGGEDLVAFNSQIGHVEPVGRSSEASSKAVDNLSSKTAFASGDEMGLYLSLSSGTLVMKGNDYGNFNYDNLKYTYNGSSFTTSVGSPSGTIYYPYRTTTVDLWGIYPYDANAENQQADAYPWTVASDQTQSNRVVVSDFLSAVTKNVVPNGTVPVNLNFKHRMTLLRIAIAFPEEVDGKKLNGTTPIAELYLDNLKIKAAVNLIQETAAPATGASAETIKPLYLGYTDTNGRAMDSLFYQAIIVPQTVTSSTKQLMRMVVNYEGGGQGLFILPVDADLTFASGTIHYLSLSFDTQMRLRLDNSGKVAWDENSNYNHASSVWKGENQTITIDNTVWAKGFLVADGTSGNKCRIGTPLDEGLLFQFGSLVGWDKAKVVKVKPGSVATPAWNNNYYNNSTPTSGELFTVLTKDNNNGDGKGDACRFYLGSSWRMPTSSELFALTGKTSGTNIAYATSGVTGAFDNTTFPSNPGTWWGPKFAAKDTLVAPYMRHGGSFSATQVHSTTSSLVWSASLSGAANAQTLAFTSTNFTLAAGDRKQGGAIRCVWIRKIYVFDNPELKDITAGTLRFGFNFPCKWEIKNIPTWLTVTSTSGTATVGDATKTVTIQGNTATATTRTGNITIEGVDTATNTKVALTVIITQNP